MSTFFARKGLATEDALTGDLHDLLAWWDVPTVVTRLLSRAGTFDGERVRRDRWFDLPLWDAYRIEAWPSRPSGEPDLVLRLYSHNAPVATVVIEVKYGAEKSSVESAEPGTRDQLEKYYSDLRSEGVATRVIYLTAHTAAPNKDLRTSWERIEAATPDSAPDHLAWISWADVEACLHQGTDAPGAEAFRRAAESFCAVLRRYGLCHVTGAWNPLSIPSLGAPPKKIFYDLRAFYWGPDGVTAPTPAAPTAFYHRHDSHQTTGRR